jgi:hypothetical protein
VPAGGSASTTNGTFSSTGQGGYIFQIVPVAGTWRDGLYVYSIRVTAGGVEYTSLTSMIVP